MNLYSWQEFYRWLDVQQENSENEKKITGVAVDSREVKPGNVFFALSGQKTNGHCYLEDVAKKGALAAVVEKSYQGPSFGLRLIRVNHPLEALQAAAKKRLQETSVKVIAVTGSLGKTSTKEFLYALLKESYKVTASSGNKNSQIGLALVCLNELQGDEEYLVLEMGMSMKGHIEKLVQIAPPQIALITYVALVHAENFASIDEIAKAKAEIFSSPKTELAFINYDSDCRDVLISSVRSSYKTYSLQKDSKADFYLQRSESQLVLFEGRQQIELPFIKLPAEHMYMNLLAALAVASSCGVSKEAMKEALLKLEIPKARLQEVSKKGVLFINDAYNAAEVSMKGALLALKARADGKRKVAILGHMRELGTFSAACHKRVGECALESVDRLICLGEDCKELVAVWESKKRQVNWFLDFDEMMHFIKEEVQEGDLVLVKGARSLQLEKVIESF